MTALLLFGFYLPRKGYIAGCSSNFFLSLLDIPQEAKSLRLRAEEEEKSFFFSSLSMGGPTGAGYRGRNATRVQTLLAEHPHRSHPRQETPSYASVTRRATPSGAEDRKIFRLDRPPADPQRLPGGHDLPEHRHIAGAIRGLARWCRTIAKHCRTSAELIRHEELRWGGRVGVQTVYEQRDLPRVKTLEELALQSDSLGGVFARMLSRHAFLSRAGRPRTPLTPTPAFMGRPAYADAYQTIREAQQRFCALVDGSVFATSLRSLASVFEYWCFLQITNALRSRFGTPQPRSVFQLVDGLYRPELMPGQSFRFTRNRNCHVTVTYEPEFMPWREAVHLGHAFGASLTSDPLRPDIVLEMNRPSHRPVMLILDAKSTASFSPRRFREMTDYARQIFDPTTGYQPVRQVFLLHRDASRPVFQNIPEYLAGRTVESGTSILGAVACNPADGGGVPNGLSLVLDGFLRTFD